MKEKPFTPGEWLLFVCVFVVAKVALMALFRAVLS